MIDAAIGERLLLGLGAFDLLGCDVAARERQLDETIVLHVPIYTGCGKGCQGPLIAAEAGG